MENEIEKTEVEIDRAFIINHYIKKYNLSSYLEIGTYDKNNNFNSIECKEKLCIDPDPNAKADLVLTSDEFFKLCNKKFDIIFIDGLHEAHQVYKDIKNSLLHLNEGGVIVCHDCNPESLANAYDYEDYNGTGLWNGDSWKGFLKYRWESEYLCFTLDYDNGCGIIDTNRKNDIDTHIKFNIGQITFEIIGNNPDDRIKLLGLRK